MRRNWTIIALIVALAAVAGWGFWERANRIAYSNTVEANSQREFYNALSRSEEAEVALAKSLVANSSRQQIFYLTEVWNRATEAQQSLSQVPVPNLNLSATRKFLAQLGDYSLSLSRKVASGNELAAADRDNLTRLQTQLGEFSRRMHDVADKLNRGGFRWTYAAGPRGGIFPATPAQNGAARAAVNPGDLAELGNLDRQLQELPALTYDGPFSDNMLRITPKGLTGPKVDRAAAEAKALAFARAAGPANPRVGAYRRTGGPMPAHSFVLTTAPSGAGRIALDVSEKGGHVIQMLLDRPLEAPRLDSAAALEKAQSALQREGFPNMIPTYSIREAGSQTITFVLAQDETLIYPDQIKVKVALDNGEIVGWDATTYLTNHHSRKLSSPLLSEAEARARVNPDLQAGRGRRCIIPTAGGNEVQAWEFSTTINGDRFVVYINALTGAEEQILKIIETPGGQLTM